MKLSNQAITALALASAFLPAAFARRRDEDVDVKSCHQIRRMLTSAVNISTSGGSINVARADMVTAIEDALSGGESFVALQHTSGEENVIVLKLTSNESSLPQDTSGAFQASGKFVMDEPDTTYTVDCPEFTAGAFCTVVGSDGEDCGLAYMANGDHADLKDMCGDATYAVGMKFVNLKSGMPHFVLLATRDDGSSNSECPSMIMFDGTSTGQKEVFTTKNHIAGSDTDDIHSFGKVTLSTLLKAESNVEAILGEDYNYLTNTCIHYAGRILRDLGFEYEKEVADFLLSYIKDSKEYRDMAQMEIGGSRVDKHTRNLLASSEEAWKEYLTEFMYSSMEHEWN